MVLIGFGVTGFWPLWPADCAHAGDARSNATMRTPAKRFDMFQSVKIANRLRRDMDYPVLVDPG
jgi:hypothetical protein